MRSFGKYRARVRGRLTGVFVVLALGALSLAGGCGGGGDDGPGPDPVACTITNVSTGTQTSWLVGIDPPANLRWNHTGAATAVKIELLKAGAVVAVVAASTANDDFYAWTPTTGGQANGTDFGLRVTALGETGCAGEKTGLTLTDVSGCTVTWVTADLDTINAGDAVPLQWNSAATAGQLDIELWQDDLGGEPELVGVVVVETPDDGEFLWNPVDSFHFGTDNYFQLKLVDPLVPGCEALTGTFRLVDTENCACRVTGFSSGTIFSEAQVLGLTLDQDFGSGFVNLRLLAGAELVPGGTIADNVPVSQVYNWTVNDYGYTGADRTRFRIRAIDAADGYCVGQSDVFAIN